MTGKRAGTSRAAYVSMAARIVRLTEERDQARDWAVQLEQRLAAIESPAVAAAFDAALYPEDAA